VISLSVFFCTCTGTGNLCNVGRVVRGWNRSCCTGWRSRFVDISTSLNRESTCSTRRAESPSPVIASELEAAGPELAAAKICLSTNTPPSQTSKPGRRASVTEDYLDRRPVTSCHQVFGQAGHTSACVQTRDANDNGPQLSYCGRSVVWLYHTERPHQALGNNLLTGKPIGNHKPFDSSDQIICRERLGGLLKHYSRMAA